MLHFKIIAIVGDGAQCNRQFQNRFFTKTIEYGDKILYEKLMIHRVTEKPIFYISDPSHMVKKIVSSLSSSNRNIFMNVKGNVCNLSLSSMMILWMSFNNNSGLNEQHDFKMTDFVKNSFQAMRVGPCIKVTMNTMHNPSLHTHVFLCIHIFQCTIQFFKLPPTHSSILGPGTENDWNDR